jgi:hypothetical protein
MSACHTMLLAVAYAWQVGAAGSPRLGSSIPAAGWFDSVMLATYIKRTPTTAMQSTRRSTRDVCGDVDDSLTLETMQMRFRAMLDYRTAARPCDIDRVREKMLNSRLQRLPLCRSWVTQSTVLNGGRGVFARRTLQSGELVTFYPGDALLHWEEGSNSAPATAGERGPPTHVGVSFGSHVPSVHRDHPRAASRAGRAYELPTCLPLLSILGSPNLVDDAAYLGHMINDCGSLSSVAEMAEYTPP